MNRSRLIGGIICLVIAGVLTVANLRLPPEDLMFQIGDLNMPWIPAVVLAIVGIILLATAFRGEEAQEETKDEVSIDPEKSALNKRLEGMAWGCFLIMLGGFMFVPEEIIKGGWWSIGVGLIMLGLNAARYFNGLRMSGFTTFLGIISVIGGVLDLVAGIEGINGAVLLIVLGGYLILKPYFDKRQLFGKAEES
jgi:putative Mn2+ efflux pump MntP